MPDDLNRFPILGPRARGTTAHHEVSLPGEALTGERWTVTSVTGTQPGPAVFVNAGIHGAEYPPIEAVIELARTLDPQQLRGTVVLLPVVNLPAFWERSAFVCPIDGKNLNRQFPGRPDGSYCEQLAYALTTTFMDQADAHIDLHCGDMVEALLPFSICQRADNDASRKAREIARVFGLPYVLVIDRPVQPAAGTTTCAAAVQRGVPSIVAEAGGVGQLDWEAVALLHKGTLRVLGHLGMLDDVPPPAPEPTVLTRFEWLYSPAAGMFYPTVRVGDDVVEDAVVGTIGSFTGERIAEIRAPVGGTVLFLTTSPAMKDGGLLMGIGVA